MPLTPSSVAGQQFRIVRRGYAVEEVDAFLDEVESHVNCGGVCAPTRPDDPAAGAVALLQLAEQTAGARIAAAEAAAAQLLAAAGEQADRLLAEAQLRCGRLHTQIEELTRSEQATRERFTVLLRDQLRLLDRDAATPLALVRDGDTA